VRCMFHVCMVHVLCMRGVCVVYVWCMCGVCVVYVWCMCDVSVKHVWCMCGVCGVAFSSENWRRPETEINALMSLFLTALRREVKKMHKNNIRLKVIGNRSRFSKNIQQAIEQAEQLTANNDGCTVVIAADYGGQWDIVQAARALAEDVRTGEIEIADITEQSLQSRICLGDLAMPDLCIRTGGERRISNFLLWQMAYTELYFTDLYWPDFGQAEFLEALTDFQHRDRRFGHTSNNTSSNTNNSSEELGA